MFPQREGGKCESDDEFAEKVLQRLRKNGNCFPQKTLSLSIRLLPDQESDASSVDPTLQPSKIPDRHCRKFLHLMGITRIGGQTVEKISTQNNFEAEIRQTCVKTDRFQQNSRRIKIRG